MGGGVKPTPEVVKIRARMYAMRKFHHKLTELDPLQRSIVAFSLKRFEIPTHSIQYLLDVCRRTLYDDLLRAQLYVIRPKGNDARYFIDHVNSLTAFILYNAKYTQ